MVHQMPSAIAGSATPHSSHSTIDARYWRSTSQALRISAAYRLITRLPPRRERTRAGSLPRSADPRSTDQHRESGEEAGAGRGRVLASHLEHRVREMEALHLAERGQRLGGHPVAVAPPSTEHQLD